MNASDVIDAHYEAAPLAVVQDAQHAPALFGTSDPVAVIEQAVRVADALKAVIVSKKLVSPIQGKEYVQVEAWLTLAAMLRLTTVCEWSRRIENGWEARVYVRDANGNTVAAAEAQCLSTERSKKSWEDYALRSMAQTRATSKSLRSLLGFIVVLAGYQATPIEEMPDDQTPQPARRAAQPTTVDQKAAVIERARKLGAIPPDGTIDDLKAYCADNGVVATLIAVNAHFDALQAATPQTAPEKKASAQQRALAMKLHAELQHDDDIRHEMYKARFGVTSFNDLTVSQATAVIKELQSAVDTINNTSD